MSTEPQYILLYRTTLLFQRASNKLRTITHLCDKLELHFPQPHARDCPQSKSPISIISSSVTPKRVWISKSLRIPKFHSLCRPRDTQNISGFPTSQTMLSQHTCLVFWCFPEVAWDKLSQTPCIQPPQEANPSGRADMAHNRIYW